MLLEAEDQTETSFLLIRELSHPYNGNNQNCEMTMWIAQDSN